MFVSSRKIFAAAVFLCCSIPLRAQDQPPTHIPRPKRVGLAKWEPKAQETTTPYWTLEPGWNTELEVRNNLAQRELTVTPVLRTAAGREIELTPVNVASEQVVAINLQDVIARVDPGVANRVGSFGSVALRFAGLDAANIFAGSIVHREGHPIDFHFDGEYAGLDSGSGGIEGIWWLPAETSTAYLILGNPSHKPVNGNLILSRPSGAGRQIPIKLGPRQTTRLDLREVLGPSANGEMGGLSLSLANKEMLSASEIVFDETTGLAAIMKLFQREPDEKASSHILRAPMMALSQPDPALAFPAGTVLVPRILLWNAGTSSLPLSAAIDWRADSNSGTYQVPSLQLMPGQVKILDLGDFQRTGSIPAAASWSTVRLEYTGRTADLVAVALSYDKTSRYGLQTPFAEGTNRLLKGSMWHVDGTHNTLITAGNGGTESTIAEATLFYHDGQGRYRVEKALAPGQQLWLDVGQLIRNQVPDSDGHTMPPDTMTGSYELRDLDHATVGLLYEGKLVIDKTYGHAAYGCASCCGYYTPGLLPNPFTGPPGIDNPDSIQAQEQCGGYIDDVTGAGYYWQSSNTAVARLPTRTLHTVAIGSATGSAYIQLQALGPSPKCPTRLYTPQQPVDVSQFNVTYSAYIPVDHVSAPATSFCTYQLVPYVYNYMGDANRGTYRATESIVTIPDTQQSSGYFPGTGQTRQYAAYSPKNGSTLSSLDEDGIAHDCYLWNDAATASTSGLQQDVSYPYAHQSQVHYYGSASNPLESQLAAIQWDMRTVIDTTNPSAPTAIVSYNHTCYPSHQIRVNGKVVYLYTPPRNDATYIFGCLVTGTGKIVGQQPTPVPVPLY